MPDSAPSSERPRNLVGLGRAELAADLLASLDGERERDVEAAWSAEIERRAREALADPDDDVAWEAVRAELHAAPTR